LQGFLIFTLESSPSVLNAYYGNLGDYRNIVIWKHNGIQLLKELYPQIP